MVKDKLTRYLRGFNLKFRKASQEAIEKFDEYYLYAVEPDLKNIFYEYWDEWDKNQRQLANDLLYKLLFVKGSLDGRYDNVLLGNIEARVNNIKHKRR